jgi:hypothetical protein
MIGTSAVCCVAGGCSAHCDSMCVMMGEQVWMPSGVLDELHGSCSFSVFSVYRHAIG